MSLQEILEKFLDHLGKIEELRLRRDDRYELEFQQLKALTEKLKEDPFYVCSYGEKEVNRPKNRYKDIVPYDYSRVVLSDTGVPDSDYINASYIKGPSGCRSYIASQGPLPNTVDDFWRMIWECEVQIIVMASSEIEGGKHKCERYWVYEGEKCQFGNLEVTLVNLKKICTDFIVRTMNVKCQQEERMVIQFHYVTWPDHGVPESVIPILNMVKLVRNCQLSESIPILVHCSAGCGRTGTICSIDYVFGLLRSGRLSEDFSLFQLICDMRRQRIAMVQTKEQYLLIHRAVKALFEHHLQIIETHPYENVDFFGVPIEDADSQAKKSSSKKEDAELTSVGIEEKLILQEPTSTDNPLSGLQNYSDASTVFGQIPDLAIETVDPLLKLVDESCEVPPLPEKIRIGNNKNKAQAKNDFPDEKAQSKVKKLISTWNTGNISNSNDEFTSVFDDAETSSNNDSVFDNLKGEANSKNVAGEFSLNSSKEIGCDIKEDGEFYNQGNNYSEKAVIIRKPSIAKLKALFEKSSVSDNSPCPSPETDSERKQSLTFDTGETKETVPPKKRSLSPFKKTTEGNVASRYKDTALKLYSELKMTEKQINKETEETKQLENTVSSTVPEIFRRVGSQRNYNPKPKSSVWYDDENPSNEKAMPEEKPALPVKRSKSMKVQSITENAFGIFRRPSPLVHRRAETSVASYLAVEEAKKKKEMKASKQLETKTSNEQINLDKNIANKDAKEITISCKSKVEEILADTKAVAEDLDSTLQNLKGIQKEESILKPNRKPKQFPIVESIPGTSTSNPVQLMKIKEFENETHSELTSDSLSRKKKKEINLTEECKSVKMETVDLQINEELKSTKTDKHFAKVDVFDDIPPPLPAKQNSPANSPHMRRSTKENQKKVKKKYPPIPVKDSNNELIESITLENCGIKDKIETTCSETPLLETKRDSENLDQTLDSSNKLKTTSENIPKQNSSDKYSDLQCSDPQKETCDQIIRDCQEYLNSTSNQDCIKTPAIKTIVDSVGIIDEKKPDVPLPEELPKSEISFQKDLMETPPVKVPRQKLKKSLSDSCDSKPSIKQHNQKELTSSTQTPESNNRNGDVENNCQTINSEESTIQKVDTKKEEVTLLTSLTRDDFEGIPVVAARKLEENDVQLLKVNLDEEEKLLQLLKADNCEEHSKIDDALEIPKVSNANRISDHSDSVKFDLNLALGNLPKSSGNSSCLISSNMIVDNKIMNDSESSLNVADKGYESLWLSETGHPVIKDRNEASKIQSNVENNDFTFNSDDQHSCEQPHRSTIQVGKENPSNEHDDSIQPFPWESPNNPSAVNSLSNLTYSLPFKKASSECPMFEPRPTVPIRSSSCSPQMKSKWSHDRASLDTRNSVNRDGIELLEEKPPVENDDGYWNLKSCHLVKEAMTKQQNPKSSSSPLSSPSKTEPNRMSFSHTVKELHSLIDDLHLQVPHSAEEVEVKQFSDKESSEFQVIQQLLEELLVDSNPSEPVKPKPYKPRPLPRSIIPAVFKSDQISETKNPEYAVVRKNELSKLNTQQQKEVQSDSNGQTNEKHEYEELRLAVEGAPMPTRKENDYEEIRLQHPPFPPESYTPRLSNNIDPSDDLEEPIHVSRSELFGIPDDTVTDSPSLHIYERVQLDPCLTSTDDPPFSVNTSQKFPNQEQKPIVRKYSDSRLSFASKEVLKQNSDIDNNTPEIFKMKSKNKTVPSKRSSNPELKNNDLYTKVNKSIKQESKVVGVVKRQVVDSPKLQTKNVRSRYSKDDMEISPLPPPRNKRNSGQRHSFLFEKAADSFWWTQTLPGRWTESRRRRSISEVQPEWGEEWDSEEDCTPPVPVKTKDAYIVPAETRASARAEHNERRKKVTSLTTPPTGDISSKGKPGKFNFLTKIGLKTTEAKDLEGYTPPLVVPVSQTTHVNYEGTPGFVFPCRLPKKPRGPRPPPLSWKTERAGTNC